MQRDVTVSKKNSPAEAGLCSKHEPKSIYNTNLRKQDLAACLPGYSKQLRNLHIPMRLTASSSSSITFDKARPTLTDWEGNIQIYYYYGAFIAACIALKLFYEWAFTAG